MEKVSRLPTNQAGRQSAAWRALWRRLLGGKRPEESPRTQQSKGSGVSVARQNLKELAG